MTELETVATKIEAATCPEDLFGPPARTHAEQRDAIAVTFRAAVKVIHPDHFVGTLAADRAGAVFRKLTDMKTQALAKVAAGTYGKRHVAAPAAAPHKDPVVVRTGKREYVVGRMVASGDYADLYETEGGASLFKVVRSGGDNDLAENEARVLGKIFPKSQAEERGFRLLPRLLDSFELRSKGSRRRVNVLPFYREHVSLAEVIGAFDHGLDFRDAVWMFKRILYAIGFIHRLGYAHGGIVPTHVLVHPTEHGARLVDWGAAVPLGSPIKFVSKAFRGLYPPEVIAKQPATAATDIFMAAMCLSHLLRASDVPAPLQAFLKGCLIKNQARRPGDAWQLHEDFDELLRRVVGKPQYRPLHMPARSPKEGH